MNDPAVFRATNFTALDWGIVAVYLLVSLVIGVMVKRFSTDMTAYIGAGRSVGVWLGVASMTGTELGLVTVMYSAEKGFKGGFAAFHIAVLAGLVTFFVGCTGFIVVPLRRLKVLTIPEFYERRFGRTTRIVGGVVLSLAGILNMGLFLKVGAMFIVGVTGLSEETWALKVVMTALLALVLVYTCLGGMISVMITDYVQFVLLSVGLLLVTALAIAQLGWNHIFTTVQIQLGEPGFNPLSEGEFGPAYVGWMAMLGLVGCAVWPTSVARALTMESTTAVKRQYMWSSISFTIRFLIPYFWGICALVFVVGDADLQREFLPTAEQLEAGAEPASALYAMPLFLGRLLPMGLLGLICAAMIAAFMSTHDSYLLCWSSVITQDVIAPLYGGELSQSARILITRVFIVLVGVFIWAWGLFYKGGDDVWDYMAITGAIYFTSAFALLFGGLYWNRASRSGALAALLAGASAVFGLGDLRIWLGRLLLSLQGSEVSDQRAGELVTSARVGLTTVCLTLSVFVLVSLLFPDRSPAAQTKESDT